MRKEKGQALLIVILTMVVALTVGLSVASRSITNIRTSTAQEESQRAFSAAEAGIEEALKSGISIAEQTLPNSAKYFANVITPVSTTEFLVPNPVLKDEATQIWLSNYNGCASPPCYVNPYNGTITIYWGDPAESCTDVAALEVIAFSGSATSPIVTRYALDPCSGFRGNNFSSVTTGDFTLQGVHFRNTYFITVSNGLIMRIIPLYKSTKIGVKGTASLPSQGKEIESTGKVVTGNNEVVRKIKVFQSNPSLPSLFDYAIFSGTNL